MSDMNDWLTMECDMSADEWQWIELIIGALGALIAIVPMIGW